MNSPADLDRSPSHREAVLNEIASTEKCRAALRRLVQQPMSRMASVQREQLEREEAKWLRLQRLLFAIDHPEFEIARDEHGILLSDLAEVHFRLERC